MYSEFDVEHRFSSGNMHIRLRGILDTWSAWSLIVFMRDNYNEQGRVFVDTRYLMDVTRQGGLEFRHNCALSGIPLKKIYFKGDKGFLLAPDGSRVIVLTMHGKKAMPRFNAKGFYRTPLGRHLIIGA